MRRILATIVFAVLFGGVGQAQITRHAGSVQIQSTAAAALDVAGGVQVGSGNVALVGTDGKINGPLSTTIIDNLSAVNLTSIPSGQLTGTIDIARFPTGGTWTISSAFTFSSGGQVNIHNTGTNALDVAGGLNIGSGNVALVGTDGKINGPLSTTIIDDLSAVNLSGFLGDVTGTGGAMVVGDNSHAHTGTTISALAAGDTTTGTFANARIAASNVTQHEGSINHDSLTGFVANEHINHTSVTLTAGNGLTGGGTIAATRTVTVGAGNCISVAATTVGVGSDCIGTAEIEASGVGTSEIADGVVTGADLNTTQASATFTVQTTVVMNDLSFYPNMDFDDCLPGQSSAPLVKMSESNAANDEIGRYLMGLPTGCTTSGSVVHRWKYITASDHPQIWVIANADGTMPVVWQANDPVVAMDWPLNPNPLIGNVLLPGQRYVNPDMPDLARLTVLMNVLSAEDRAGALTRMQAYVVGRRGWLTGTPGVANLAQVDPRYQPTARREMLRSIATQIGVDMGQVILELMVVNAQDELVWKPGLGRELSAYLTTRASTLAMPPSKRCTRADC